MLRIWPHPSSDRGLFNPNDKVELSKLPENAACGHAAYNQLHSLVILIKSVDRLTSVGAILQ